MQFSSKKTVFKEVLILNTVVTNPVITAPIQNILKMPCIK
jgi:hypothetical protein